MTKSIEEQIAELDRKVAQIRARKSQLMARRRQADEKARVHRLIQVGAILEKATGIQFDTKESREELSTVLQTRDDTARGKTAAEIIASLWHDLHNMDSTTRDQFFPPQEETADPIEIE